MGFFLTIPFHHRALRLTAAYSKREEKRMFSQAIRNCMGIKNRNIDEAIKMHIKSRKCTHLIKRCICVIFLQLFPVL